MDRPLARSANSSREERRKRRLAENPGLRTLCTTNYKDVVHTRRIAQSAIKHTTGGGPGPGLAEEKGAVGYVPEDSRGAGLGDKIGGLSEEIRGKVTHKPELVEHSHERCKGDLKCKEKAHADVVDPFHDDSQKPDQDAVKLSQFQSTEPGLHQDESVHAVLTASAGTQKGE